jgi:hypothetical protein
MNAQLVRRILFWTALYGVVILAGLFTEKLFPNSKLIVFILLFVFVSASLIFVLMRDRNTHKGTGFLDELKKQEKTILQDLEKLTRR